MNALRVTPALLLMAACTTTPLTDAGIAGDWRLATLNGAPLEGSATMTLAADGAIHGEAPCNQFHGSNTAALPGFRPGPLAVTRRACLWLGGEDRFFAALGAVERAELQGERLVLTGPGVRMDWTREPAR